MNLNISCYRCGRATCGQVWRIVLFSSAAWGNMKYPCLCLVRCRYCHTRNCLWCGAADGRY